MWRNIFAVLMLLAVAVPAPASAPEAWAAGDKAAASACIRASGFRNATVLPNRARYPDTVGYDAMLVRGTWPQPQMKAATGTMLCLWHRAHQRATVTEVPRWTLR